jgi:hypothetical protein
MGEVSAVEFFWRAGAASSSLPLACWSNVDVAGGVGWLQLHVPRQMQRRWLPLRWTQPCELAQLVLSDAD